MLRTIVTVLVVIMNIIGTLLPVYIGWSRLGMVDTYYPLIVPAFLGGGTRTKERMQLVRVSCVCGRTSSFPAGERNQRLPGAGEVSMRRAGPRTPLRQISCVGGASQGRPERGSLRFRTNGPAENVPFSARACA